MKYTLLYPNNTLEKLEFNKILDIVDNNCISPLGRAYLSKIKISSDYDFIKKALLQVNEMKLILEQESAFPSDNYIPLEEMLNYLELENSVLSQEQFLSLMLFLYTTRDIYDYFKKRENRFPALEAIFRGESYENSIVRSIAYVLTNEGEVRPGISPELDKIRKEIKAKERELDKAFQQILSTAQKGGWLEAGSESFVNGRRVLMVLTEHKRKIRGIIHDESATGKTLFMEPEITVELSNELFDLRHQERREIYKILKTLSDAVRPGIPAIRFYQKIAGIFDFIRAKALLAVQLKANMPELVNEPYVNLYKAFHPVLFLHNQKLHKSTNPISLRLNKEERILVISGPNAGGKSVTLKTVGLLQVMLQAGMLVPVHTDSKMGIFRKIFVELGDEQSIENELSTFSSRLTHMKFFTEKSDAHTLFFVDEFGTGTDPKFGGAIAEALLEELNKKEAFSVITTHYSNLKLFATNTHGIINGSMAFDKETYSPLYQLKLGQPGSSHAFEIAHKIGLPENIIQNARGKMEEKYQDFDSLLATLETDKYHADLRKKRLEDDQKQLDNLIDSYRSLKDDLEKNKKKILLETKQKGLEELDQTNKKFQGMLKKLEEEKQKAAQQKLQQEIAAKKESLKTEVQQIKQQTRKKPATNEAIEVGSRVRLQDSETTGVVEELRSNKALVAFGNLRTIVPLAELEHVGKGGGGGVVSKKTSVNYQKVGEDFRQTIDVRGMRAEEAMNEVERQLDKALMLGVYSLRILHGKGDGILRKTIRDMLRKYSFVKDFQSENPDFGGEGVTIVELE